MVRVEAWPGGRHGLERVCSGSGFLVWPGGEVWSGQVGRRGLAKRHGLVGSGILVLGSQCGLAGRRGLVGIVFRVGLVEVVLERFVLAGCP